MKKKCPNYGYQKTWWVNLGSNTCSDKFFLVMIQSSPLFANTSETDCGVWKLLMEWIVVIYEWLGNSLQLLQVC